MMDRTRMHGTRISPLLLAAIAALILISSAHSAAAVLLPGEMAPDLVARGEAGQPYVRDEASTRGLLLVFVKPGDRYTSETLSALDLVMERQEKLGEAVDSLLIISRTGGPPAGEDVQAMASPGWKLVWDVADQTYKAFRIIATPTVVIVDPSGEIAAVNPGYDPDMARRMRAALGELAGVEVGPATRPAPPNLTLQMGRRLASRGLWDSALRYYGRAGDLPPEALMEMVLIHLEIDQIEEAEAILERLQDQPGLASQVEALRERVAEKKAELLATPVPPKVVR